MSYSSGEAAEQIVRMTLNGAEVAAKISGKAAERLAVLLYAVLRDQKKTRGKIRLTNMLKSGKEVKVFSISDKDLTTFCREAKKYGVLYCVLKDKTAADKHTDVFVRAEDASKINRIFERFKIATADIGSARAEVTRAMEQTEKKTETENPPPDRNTTEKDKDEAFLDALLNPTPNKEVGENQNPTAGRTAKPCQSEPLSKKQGRADTDGRNSMERERPSVRQTMKELREEQQKANDSREKPARQKTHKHNHTPKKNKSKER